jgi:tRNA threonylcarbamoyladenosine biosynthesis protein TsaE
MIPTSKSDSAIDLPDLAATDAFGRRLAKALRRGDVVAGVSPDFGDVPSPTFTLVQTYPVALSNGPAELWHFDLYRLDRPDQVYELGIEDALAEGVSLIEWPELAAGLLPKEQVLTIELQITTGQARRARLEGGVAWRDRLAGLS